MIDRRCGPIRSIPGSRPDSKRRLATGAATPAQQRALKIGEPGERWPAAHQQFMGNGRFVPASAARGFDQVPGTQILQTEVVARGLTHWAVISFSMCSLWRPPGIGSSWAPR